MLRSGVAHGSPLQPRLFRSTTRSAYSTLTVVCWPGASMRRRPWLAAASCPGYQGQHRSKPASSVLHLAGRAATGSLAVSCRRDGSTLATKPPPSDNMPALDWESFFRLRKTRRMWQVAFSAITSIGCGAAGAMVLSSGAADSLTAQIPLDPILALGLITLGCIAMGWVVGPSLGNAVFYLINRKYKAPMTLKEGQFFTRIKKNRVDPTNSSTGNPVPDFYGEKISSVAGYRQWLKDQRAFNKKRTTFI